MVSLEQRINKFRQELDDKVDALHAAGKHRKAEQTWTKGMNKWHNMMDKIMKPSSKKPKTMSAVKVRAPKQRKGALEQLRKRKRVGWIGGKYVHVDPVTGRKTIE